MVLIFSQIRTTFCQEAISEELMPAARHPNRWWDWCMSEDEKKEIDPIQYEGIETFGLFRY